jgi:L-lactate dehydrogenase complex protein LldG
MDAMTDSRKLVLTRIRAAAQEAAQGPQEPAGAYAAVARNYARAGTRSAEARVALMRERLGEYGAEVVECTPEELPAAIAAQIAGSGRRRFVAPPGIPDAWLAEPAKKIEGFKCALDHGLETGEIEEAEGVMTAAFCGIADSGTIVLHHSDGEGRRVLTLLPDWHLCILKGSQVVETLPEYFVRAQGSGAADQGPEIGDEAQGPPKLVTWISGPSATADIEMTRIQGVHGPRFLHVILVDDRGGESAGN